MVSPSALNSRRAIRFGRNASKVLAAEIVHGHRYYWRREKSTFRTNQEMYLSCAPVRSLNCSQPIQLESPLTLLWLPPEGSCSSAPTRVCGVSPIANRSRFTVHHSRDREGVEKPAFRPSCGAQPRLRSRFESLA